MQRTVATVRGYMKLLMIALCVSALFLNAFAKSYDNIGYFVLESFGYPLGYLGWSWWAEALTTYIWISPIAFGIFGILIPVLSNERYKQLHNTSRLISFVFLGPIAILTIILTIIGGYLLLWI